MTALLEFKQKLKDLYGKMELYLMPVFKFAVAFVYFLWINENMGYMQELNSIFVLLILALIPLIAMVSITFLLSTFFMTCILFPQYFCLTNLTDQNVYAYHR